MGVRPPAGRPGTTPNAARCRRPPLASAAVFVLLAGILAALPAPVLAHGLLLRLENAESTVAGVAYYTNGAIAAGEYVELVDLDAPDAAPVGAPTDAAGGFRFAARAGGRYRLVAHGDEGHRTELEFTLGEARTPHLVDDDAEAAAGPPAWAVIGGVLLLATAALLLRRLSRYGRASAASRNP
jgi:hypothetical protein